MLMLGCLLLIAPYTETVLSRFLLWIPIIEILYFLAFSIQVRSLPCSPLKGFSIQIDSKLSMEANDDNSWIWFWSQ